jgi:hypothetical protein
MSLDFDLLDRLEHLAADPATPEETLRSLMRALARFIAHAQFADSHNSQAALQFALRAAAVPVAHGGRSGAR